MDLTTQPSPAPAPSSGNLPAPQTNEQIASVGFHESDHLRTVTTSVEEEFLMNAFGVVVPRRPDLGENYSENLANAISRRIITVVDRTRSGVDVAGMRRLLTEKLNIALERIAVRDDNIAQLRVLDPLKERRVRAIVEAIRESIPAAVINDVIRYGIPAFVSEDRKIPEHLVVIKDCLITSPRFAPKSGVTAGAMQVGTCTIEIDTRNYFWRRDHDNSHQLPPNNTTLFHDLKAALITKRQSLDALGIRIIPTQDPQPLPESFRITQDADIQAILGGPAAGIDVSQRYDKITFYPASLSGARCVIDTAKIIRYRDRTGKLVASMDRPELLAELGRNGSRIWDFISVDPPGAAITAATHAEVADELFRALGTNPANQLAIQSVPFHIIQREIAEQNRFFEQMREGSDNHWGAAMATMLLMRHKDLRDVLGARDAADIQTDLNRARDNYSIIALLEGLEALTPPGGNASWTDFENKEANIHAELGTVATRIVGDIITLAPGIAIEERHTITALPSPPALPNTPDLVSARSWLSSKLTETQNRQREFQKFESEVRKTYMAVVRLGIAPTCPLIQALFDPITHNALHASFVSGLNMRTIAEEIRTVRGVQGKTKAELEADIKKYQKEMDSAAITRVTGAEAQHRVISGELMRYHGLTEAEARSGTNVLRARSLLDTDMAQAAERFANNLHEEEEQEGVSGFIDATKRFGENVLRSNVMGSRDRSIIQNIAHACHIPLDNHHQPLWSQTIFYDDLIAAYHALDKLKKQTFYNRSSDVPWDMRLRNGAGVDREMREISRALFLQHAKGVLQFYGPSVGLKDGDVERILADPQKLEYERILQKILSSAPSPEILHKVSHAIEHAGGRTQPVRRFVSSTLFGKDWGAVTGASNPLSIRGVLYGNKYASALGAGTGGVEGAKWSWSRKVGIAAGAGLGFLVLGAAAPVGIGLAAYFGGKHLFAPKTGDSTPH